MVSKDEPPLASEVPIAALHDRRRRGDPPITLQIRTACRGMALSAAYVASSMRGCTSAGLHDHRQRQRSFLFSTIGCAHCPPTKDERTGEGQRFPACAPCSLFRRHAWRPGHRAAARIFSPSSVCFSRDGTRKWLRTQKPPRKNTQIVLAIVPPEVGSSRGKPQGLFLESRNRVVSTWGPGDTIQLFFKKPRLQGGRPGFTGSQPPQRPAALRLPKN